MSRPETVELWRQRLQRFDSASMTVAQFCQLEGASQASFYNQLGDDLLGGFITSLCASDVLPELHEWIADLTPT